MTCDWDADINLGCPQRIAHAGHFGSYLLDEVDRPLVLSMVSTLSSGLSIPVFVKIRLLDQLEDSIRLCEQLMDAGAALIAIHARYRVNLVGRTGPGARDGPAHLDQVQTIITRLRHRNVPIVANGNVKTWQDVTHNREFTQSQGIMSAEGLLDDPALFYPASAYAASNPKPTKGQLVQEYWQLTQQYPVSLKTLVFHLRRMAKDEFTKFQLLDDLLECTTCESVEPVIQQLLQYLESPDSFQPDAVKAKKIKDAIEKRKQNESKRKEFEARMVRKAKREMKPLDFYLNIGVELPTSEELSRLKCLTKEESLKVWKEKYSQHCYTYHFDPQRCPRERTCAFLHVDIGRSDSADADNQICG